MNNPKWFDRGAQAVARLWPEYQDHYVCPLCTRVFPRAQLGELTFDHVPPKSLGGQKIVLTCHACNSRSGHKLDHHMRTEQDVVEVGLGTPSRPQRTTVELGGYELIAEVVTSGDTIQIFGLPKSNHPDASRKFAEKLGRLSEDGQWQGQSISLSMKRKYDHKSTQVGYLRAAYLAGFAVFGYSYSRSPALQAVRTQILDPDREHVSIPIGTSPTANRSDRRIILIRDPAPLRGGLAFQMGRYIVLLPGSLDDTGFYQRACDESARSQESPSRFRGDVTPWPQEPRYLLDLRHGGKTTTG